MRAIRTRQIFQAEYPNTPPSVYGSNRAAQFLRDLIRGQDSLDIITIGDSNAGNPGAYGFQRGIHRVLSYQYGVDIYATPLMPGGGYLASNPTATVALENGMLMTGHGLFTVADNAAGGTGTTGNARLMTVHSDSGEIDALKTALGFNATNYTNDGTTMLLRPQARQWTPVSLPSGVTWTSQFGADNTLRIGNGTAAMTTPSPLAYGSTGGGNSLCQYRLVYGTFNASGGQFKLSVYNITAFGLNVRSGQYITTQTSGGGYGYKTATLDFTTQTSATPGVYLAWDGNNAAGHQATGPFSALWWSAIQKNKKGYCTTNLTYHGGATGTMLADRIEGADKVLDMFLKELRERQNEAGGSGRVLVFVNYGINSDTSPTAALAYTNAADRIKARIVSRWILTGGSVDQLAFVFVPSHPVTSGAVTPWDSNRAGVVTAATSWAQGNANDGTGTCLFDIAVPYPNVKLTKGPAPSGTFYDGSGASEAHLNGATTSADIAFRNGYDAVAGAMCAALLATP